MIRTIQKKTIGEMMLSALLLVGGSVVVSCTDNHYDLDDIDMTFGIGNGELSIPGSSTTTIKLSEVLDLEENGEVKEGADGTYRFYKKGDAVNPTTTDISAVTVRKVSAESFDFAIDLSSYAMKSKPRAAKRAAVSFENEVNVGSFEYNGNLPSEVVEINNATISSDMILGIAFDDNISKLLTQISEMTITMPSYMKFSVKESTIDYVQEGNKLVMRNVSTAAPQRLAISFNELQFGVDADDCGHLTVEKSKVNMLGNIKMGISINEDINLVSGVDPSKCSIKCKIDFMNDMRLTEVTGRFAPSITLDNLGHATIGNIPDFLNEDGVKIDIENPQIILALTTDLTVPGVISGVINYGRDGASSSIAIGEKIKVKAASGNESATTRICICRNKNLVGDASLYDQIIEQDDIKNLFYPTIAKEVSFTATAKADDTQPSSFVLGKTYTIQPEYEVLAPLAFGEDANIVYTDDMDGWNDDIDDVDLKEGGYILMSANIENRVPVYLNVDAKPVDVYGNDISNEVSVEVTGEVAASTNGTDMVESPVTVKLTPKKGALKKLDGLKLVVSGSAKSTAGGVTITGIPLNAKTHTLVAKDIKIKLVGTIVADLN